MEDSDPKSNPPLESPPAIQWALLLSSRGDGAVLASARGTGHQSVGQYQCFVPVSYLHPSRGLRYWKYI